MLIGLSILLSGKADYMTWKVPYYILPRLNGRR